MILFFNPSYGILEVTVNKTTSTKEFIKFCEYIGQNNSLPRYLNILFFAPEGFREIVDDELTIIANSLENTATRFEKINISFTVSTPKELNLVSKFIESHKISNLDLFACKSVKESKRIIRRQSLSIERITYNYAV